MDIEDLKEELIKTKKKVLDGLPKEDLSFCVERLIVLESIISSAMKPRPNFTREQEDWICYQIGAWYLQWKDKIVAGACFHNLGIAKEDLKMILCEKEKTHER